MDAVEREDDHHDEVRHQQRDVEGVPAVDATEGVVGVVRLPVVAEPARRDEEECKRVELGQQGWFSGRADMKMILPELRKNEAVYLAFKECTGRKDQGLIQLCAIEMSKVVLVPGEEYIDLR
jgi:hypothetical protein